MKTSTFFAFLSGALVGAAAAILYAPQSGEKTRQQLSEGIDKEYQKIKVQLEKAKAACEKACAKAEAAIEEISEEIKDTAEEISEIAE
ncbi:MAG: YtxH domain-containing protein [Bacteroidales bacterium]|nr:YtxH domain-containing protein [Bacteroidales bacterium]